MTDEDILDAADKVLAALVRMVETAPPEVLEDADWDYADEDWVRDAVHDAHQYSIWRLAGEDHFIYRDPRVEPGRLKADGMAIALSHLLYGGWWQVPDDARMEAELALKNYTKLRAEETDEFNPFR